MWLLLFVATVGVGFVAFNYRRNRAGAERTATERTEAARALGLEFVDPFAEVGTVLGGLVQGRYVRVDLVGTGEDSPLSLGPIGVPYASETPSMEFRIAGPSRRIRLERRGLPAFGFGDGSPISGIKTGDKAFDESWRVDDDSEAHALAILEARVRSHLTNGWREEAPTVSEADLRFKLPNTNLSADQIVGWIRAGVELAGALDDPPDIWATLRKHVETDPLPEVRLTNLLALQRESTPGAPQEQARAACMAVLGHSDPRLRLASARYLGPTGVPALREIAFNFTIAADIRCNAVAGLEACDKDLRKLGGRLIRDPELSVRVQTIGSLGRMKAVEWIGELQQIATRATPSERAAAAEALGDLGLANAEGTLIALLGDEEVSVRISAAHALSSCGTAIAVESLSKAQKTEGLLGSRELKKAAEGAITAIQSRLTGASVGQLTLASPNHGGS